MLLALYKISQGGFHALSLRLGGSNTHKSKSKRISGCEIPKRVYT